MRFYFLFGIACLSLLWEVSSQWSPRASDSEFYRALGPVSSFLAQRKARNGLWPEPKTRNWVCNRWLRPRQRTARTYQRLQTISSSIFSGQRPEKMLSRAKARDKEEEIPRKPPLASACRPTRKTNRDFLQIASLSWARGVFSGIQRELGLEPEEEENLCAEPSLEHVFFFFSLDGLVTLWLSRARVCLEAVTKPRDRDEISFVESRPETVSLDGQRIDKDYEIRFAVRKLALGLSLPILFTRFARAHQRP